jgi:hypothetical protein
MSASNPRHSISPPKLEVARLLVMAFGARHLLIVGVRSSTRGHQNDPAGGRAIAVYVRVAKMDLAETHTNSFVPAK